MVQSCHHLHESTNKLGASHSRVPGFGLFWFCCLVCVSFGFVLCVFAVFLVMMMTAQWTMYRSFTSLFCGPSTADGLEY